MAATCLGRWSHACVQGSGSWRRKVGGVIGASSCTTGLDLTSLSDWSRTQNSGRYYDKSSFYFNPSLSRTSGRHKHFINSKMPIQVNFPLTFPLNTDADFSIIDVVDDDRRDKGLSSLSSLSYNHTHRGFRVIIFCDITTQNSMRPFVDER